MFPSAAYVAPFAPPMRTRSGRTWPSIAPRTKTRASSNRAKPPHRGSTRDSKHESLQQALTRHLTAHIDPTYQQTLFNYMGGTIPTLGLRMPAIKKATDAWAVDIRFAQMSGPDAKEVGLRMFKMPTFEAKIAAVLVLDEHLHATRQLGVDDLPALARLFDEGYIYGWGVADALASRVIRGIAKGGGDAAVKQVAAWRFADNLWRARCSVVGLLYMAKREEGRDVLMECCRVVVKREERFAKTCVGWALRDISRWDEDAVFDFLDHHIDWFSLESVRNATKRCTDEQKAKYVALVKQQSRAQPARPSHKRPT